MPAPFHRTSLLGVAVTCLFGALAGAPVGAQAPRGAAALTAAAVAESLSVLADLDKRLRGPDKKDASVWHRVGMLSWALAERGRAAGAPRGLDPTRFGRQADTSLRIASELAPTNAQYRLMVGRYLRTSSVAMSRAAAPQFFEQALEIARQAADSMQIAEIAIEVGRVRWLKYDGLANRRIETTPGGTIRSIEDGMLPGSTDPESGMSGPMFDMKLVREALERGSMALPPSVTGEADYTKSGELFREAYAHNPANARAFRSVAMFFAERDSWTELEAFARAHTKSIPWDPWGWFGLGLATHRLGDSRGAAAAFDSALTYSAPAERQRLDRLERLRPRGDTSAMVRGSDAVRQAWARLYWLTSDPLWSREGNESRIEFLARLTFAEMRWTVDELEVRGADTHRGEVYVRYGPPDLQTAVGPDPSQGIGEASAIWVYKAGMLFSFAGVPGYGIARTPIGEEAGTTALIANQPVRWDNLAAVRVDSLPTQIARFRAAGDSVDLYLAAQPPVDSIRRYSDVGEVKGYAWLLTSSLAVVFSDSTQLSMKGAHAWRRRVVPGTYVFRSEATTVSSQRGGRSMVVFAAAETPASGFTTRGFGVSDLLFATNAEPGTAGGRRWRDLTIEPTAGALVRGGNLALVWENYDFGEQGGNAQYEVSITLTRNRGVAGRIAASIVGALATAARMSSTEDRVGAAFDRTVPHAPAFADHITIALGETPRGNYTVALQVTDKVTGKSVTRSRSFMIRE